MFSSRTNWDVTPNALTLKRNVLLQQGKHILDLTETNPTKCGLTFPTYTIISSLSNKQNIYYTPTPKGNISAREAICGYYAERNILLHPSQIILTSSSSEGYSFLFRLLCNAWDEILVPKPSYPLFDYLAALNDVTVNHYRLEYDGAWRCDVASIKEHITSKTKAIILVNPNNPTGSFIAREEWEKIYALANEYNLAIIEDEVFSDYAHLRRVELHPPTAGKITDNKSKDVEFGAGVANLSFRLNGISKMLALPQMKLGWIVVEGTKNLQEDALARLEIIADTYLSVNTPIQNALPELLLLRKEIQHTILTRVKSNYSFLQHTLNNTRITLLTVEGGWSAALRLPNTKNDDEWAIELLERKNVFTHPGHFFDFDNGEFLVMSLITEQHIFEEGLLRMRSLVGGHYV